ncbi:hypothetical protein ABPG77_009264 [Micractinium sp. CCAP 211/92]
MLSSLSAGGRSQDGLAPAIAVQDCDHKMEVLRFWPLESKVEAATFWSALGEFKLHDLKLGEGPAPLRASWTASRHASQPGLLTVRAASLPAKEGGTALALAPGGSGEFELAGDLYVLNTAERILSFDRKAAVQQACDRIWAAICSGAAEADPRLLHTVVLLTHCDLKHYKYRHWFAFPALQPPQPFALAAPPANLAAVLGGEVAAGDLAAALAAACSSYVACSGLPACLVRVNGCADSTGAGITTAPLTAWQDMQQQEGSSSGRQQLFLAVADSSALPDNPGWPLRNLLLMAAARWHVRRLPVLCLRERHGVFDATASLALDVTLPELPPGFHPAALGGWEPNERGKAGPRTADLAPAMDPRQLAEAAVQLNLRLMRWRAAPALDVGAIGAARCLLLGAGTLGCSVARALLGWGVRHITLVDNSRVAYSNPVRQSLFTFEDCLSGGRPKAAAAAEALARIFPGACARGVQLSVPMPGHPLAEAEVPQVLRDVAALEGLVDAHDVVFLLTDTRESRWLPTLLCAARGRLAINAALGFGSFMVMRHGAPLPPEPPGQEPQAPLQQGRAAEQGEGHAAVAGQGEEEQQQADLQQHIQQQRVVGQQVGQQEEAGSTPAGSEAGQQGQEDGSRAAAGAAAGLADLSLAAHEHPQPPQQQQDEQQRGREQGAALQAGSRAGTAGSGHTGLVIATPYMAAPPPRLGCYFCNDVVAPLDSTRDRSLDQQCTVARPGLSAIAGSLAVELMAAVLAHPAGVAAPPAGGMPGTSAGRPPAPAAAAARQELPLGEPAHMIRGELGGFSQTCLAGQAFSQCTACSPAVVREYRRRGADFVLEGLLEPSSLEDLTGLTELHRSSEAALEAWASSDDGEEEEGQGSEGGSGGGRTATGATTATHSDGGGAGQREEDWEEL